MEIEVSNITVISEQKITLLTTELFFNFAYHISQPCKKAGKILHVLNRIFKYMNISQRKLTANAFIMSQFCNRSFPLICRVFTMTASEKYSIVEDDKISKLTKNNTLKK